MQQEIVSGDEPVPDSIRRKRPSYTDLAGSFPAVVAILLAALYAVGALLTMADLTGAGLNVQDTLPLIPVADLLARGIGAAVAAGAALLGLLLFAACYRGYYAAPGGSKQETLWWVGGVVLMASSIAVTVDIFPVLIAIGLVVGVATLFVCDAFTQLSPGRSVIVAYIVVIAGFVVNAAVAPRPLPVAQVERTGGRVVVGSLITSADGRWSIAVHPDRIRVIPDADVTSVLVESQPSGNLHRTLREFIGLAWWVPPLVSVGMLALLGTVRWSDEISKRLKRFGRPNP